MNTCGVTRLLVPSFVVGLTVATVAGNDLAGWIAAAITAGVLALVARVRGTNQTCAIPPASTSEPRAAAEPVDALGTDQPAPKT